MLEQHQQTGFPAHLQQSTPRDPVMFSCSLAPGQGPERRGDGWDCKAPNPPGCGRPDMACPCSRDQQGAVRPRTSVLVPTSPLPESCQCKHPGVQHGQTHPGTAWSPWVSSWGLCPAPLAWSRNYVCFQRAGGVTSMDIHPQRSLVPSRQDRGAWPGCSGSSCSGWVPAGQGFQASAVHPGQVAGGEPLRHSKHDLS